MLVWSHRKTSFIDRTNNTYGMKQILNKNKFHWFSQKLPGKCQGRESHVANWGWKLGHSRKLCANLRTGYYICFTCSLCLRHKWMLLNISFFPQASVPWPSYRIFLAVLDEGLRGRGLWVWDSNRKFNLLCRSPCLFEVFWHSSDRVLLSPGLYFSLKNNIC